MATVIRVPRTCNSLLFCCCMCCCTVYAMVGWQDSGADGTDDNCAARHSDAWFKSGVAAKSPQGKGVCPPPADRRTRALALPMAPIQPVVPLTSRRGVLASLGAPDALRTPEITALEMPACVTTTTLLEQSPLWIKVQQPPLVPKRHVHIKSLAGAGAAPDGPRLGRPCLRSGSTE